MKKPKPSPIQSPIPLATPLAMSTAPSTPTPSPIPIHALSLQTQPKSTTSPLPSPALPSPKLRLKIQDLNHPAANVFFCNNNPSTALASAVKSVLSTLYHPTPTNVQIPPTRSVTLVLRSMDGVAYTTGTSLDDDHKEIHFSLDYINGIPCEPASRQRDEIQGVLVHEMVHCWQWNAMGTAPGGLIEGIADFVRLKAGLSPPHWTRKVTGDWDAGYQHTGYFLEWIEHTCGEGSVRRVNERLRKGKYVEDMFWRELFGRGVRELWEDYSRSIDKTEIDEAKDDNSTGGNCDNHIGDGEWDLTSRSGKETDIEGDPKDER